MEIIAAERNDLLFSYNVVCPLFRNSNFVVTQWNVIEKGSKKSDSMQKCKISPNSINRALCQIREHIWRTACNKLQIPLLKDRGFKIYLKEERYQFSETVKARGVVYTLLQLSDEQKQKGVIAISTGSFAYSLCHFGKKFGIPVTVVMPLSTTDEEIRMCRSHADLQATVFVYGNDMVDAHNIALRIASMKGLVYIDGNDHPNMIIGQATLGIEMMQYLMKFHAVILPTTINGCGLITGIAMAIKGWNLEVKVIEVHLKLTDDTEGHRTLFNNEVENIRKQTILTNELENTVTGYICHENPTGMLNSLIDRFIMVDDTLVIEAERLLINENINDFNASIGLAAILSGQLDDLREKRILLPLFGKIDSMNGVISEQRLVQLRAATTVPSRLL